MQRKAGKSLPIHCSFIWIARCFNRMMSIIRKSQSPAEIVFKGTKKVEQFNKKLDILLVKHETYGCLELIVLGVKKDNQAQRIYLDLGILTAEVDLSLFREAV